MPIRFTFGQELLGRVLATASTSRVLEPCVVGEKQEGKATRNFLRRNGGREYRGIRTARYTYVRDLNGPWLLFDNEQDPYQMKNLCNQPVHAELQARLDWQLKKKLKEQGDEFLPGPVYLERWGYKVDAGGTVPYRN